MKLFEQQQSGKRSQACGYCRETGHNRTECPHVAEDWKYWSKFQVPPRKQGWHRGRNSPKYWGEWYNDCMKTMIKQEAKLKKKMASATVVRSAPKCGFCGSKDHNRRNCPTMQEFIKECVTANTNYRKQVHDYVVKQLGLDVGAAIEVTKRDGYGSTATVETKIALVTKINWDKVNVFCSFQGDWNTREKYAQEFKLWALVDGQESVINVTGSSYGERGKDPKLNNLLKHDSGRWHSHHFSKVIGKSEAPLPDDWATSYQEAWTFLTKKRSFERLQEDGIVALIDKWK